MADNLTVGVTREKTSWAPTATVGPSIIKVKSYVNLDMGFMRIDFKSFYFP